MQMSGFKTKIHQIRFPIEPQTLLGELTAVPGPLALYLTGLLLRPERGNGGEGKEEGKER